MIKRFISWLLFHHERSVMQAPIMVSEEDIVPMLPDKFYYPPPASQKLGAADLKGQADIAKNYPKH